MKFKNYLTESDRTKEIGYEEIIDILKKNCKQNLKNTLNRYFIYRGIDYNFDYFFGDSNKGKPRESANTLNYYTLMIDNSKYWDKYPKRSKSFICSTNEYNSGSYGIKYIVIPYDKTTIGICPSVDIWESFKYALGDMNTLPDFNSTIKFLFDLKENYINWKSLKYDLNINAKNIDITSIFIKGDIKRTEQMPVFESFWKNDTYKKVDFTDHWEKWFDPKKNGFKVYDNLNFHLPDKEVWFSGKAVFIKQILWDSIKKELENII